MKYQGTKIPTASKWYMNIKCTRAFWACHSSWKILTKAWYMYRKVSRHFYFYTIELVHVGICSCWCTCAYRYVCMPCMWRPEFNFWCHSSRAIHLCFSLIWSLTSRLHLLTSEPPEIILSPFPSAEIKSTHSPPQPFKPGSGDWTLILVFTQQTLKHWTVSKPWPKWDFKWIVNG